MSFFTRWPLISLHLIKSNAFVTVLSLNFIEQFTVTVDVVKNMGHVIISYMAMEKHGKCMINQWGWPDSCTALLQTSVRS